MFRCGSLVELGLCAVWTRPFILVGGRLGEGENIRTASEWRPSSGSPETRSAARKSYLSSFLRRVNLCIYKHFLQPASALRIISASCFALVLNHLTGLKCAVALARPTVFFFFEGRHIYLNGRPVLCSHSSALCCIHWLESQTSPFNEWLSCVRMHTRKLNIYSAEVSPEPVK